MPINHLPADVLPSILRNVYHDARGPRIESSSSEEMHLDPWGSVPARSPVEHPGPECLASVCSYWREVMSNATVFWGRFVVWTGRDPTPLSRISQYLDWSGDHPLDIFVLRRYDPSLHDLTENACMRSIVKLLLAHVRRWRTIVVKCLLASSLPRPHNELIGCADILVRLNLDSLVDDLPPVPGSLAPVRGMLYSPVLEYLSMHGAHFRASYVAPHAQLRLPMPPILGRVRLTGYSARQPPFPLVDLLRCLVACTQLANLVLASLHVDCSRRDAPLVDTQAGWGPNVEFVDMAGDAISEYGRLLSYPYVEAMTLTGCSRPSAPADALLPESTFLLLGDLPDGETVLHYLACVHSCKHLWLTDCAGLRPDVLRAFGRPAGDDVWMCPNVKSLSIMRAPLVGSADVRAVLEARLARHAASGFAENTDPPYVVASVEELYVWECGELAPEDQEWFDTNVASVTWGRWVGGHEEW